MTDLPITPTPAGNMDLQALQHRRKQVLAAGVVLWALLLLFTGSRWDGMPDVRAVIEGAGLLAILVCIAGRTWCTLYIGGLKKRELITTGPYSVVRNPLYVFTSIGAAGIGAQNGSMVLAALLFAAALAVFNVVARREEAFLASAFPEFAAYSRRVARFWPRLSLWQEADELRVKPRLVRRTFLDACVFLLAVPAADAAAWLQKALHLPVLFTLP